MRSLKRIIAAAALTGAAVGIFSMTANSIPNPRADIGRGERLALVIGGSFLTQVEAELAASRWAADEIDGFFIAPSDAFEGAEKGRWLLVSAFRTMLGANEFEQLAAAAGFPETTWLIARYMGDTYIGLGQEPSPDGTGPLEQPLPAGHPAWLG
jgi:hypothetical protein